MFSLRNSLALAPLALQALAASCDQEENDIPYSPCPLIRAYYPPPTINKDSKELAGLVNQFTSLFDQLIEDGGSEQFGEITPNTTSFSVVLFSGAAELEDEPSIFEYHYTAPKAKQDNITMHTKFPVGDVTMVLTVYAWLVQNGEQWEAPITKFLPELKSEDDAFGVPWDDVTIGSLAGQLSGLARESYSCEIGKPCDFEKFVEEFAQQPPVFLPDTTPVVSYAAFQLLAFAIQRDPADGDFASVLQQTVFGPLSMTNSGFLGEGASDVFAADGLNMSQYGEQGALSFVSSIEDLSRLGHAMLSSKLVSPAITRRWLQGSVDTSNLRNGVGRPWEVYRAGEEAISPVVSVMTKSGTLGQYASYFGLTPDFNAGFAIVAHDPTVEDRKLDLNVYADVVSGSLVAMRSVAAQEMMTRYAGQFAEGDDSFAVLNATAEAPGLAVLNLTVVGTDLRLEAAKRLAIEPANLDFRLYPTNVGDDTRQQFVAVFQDEAAPVDMGTPTCITWQEVGAVAGIEYRFVLELGDEGVATGLSIQGTDISLKRDS